jgi:FemAB-related protein (PEP-CTERM system-associated)
LEEIHSWDAFVGGCRSSSFCHLAGWRAILEDVMGHETYYLTARLEDGRLEGVLPLVRVRSRLFGHYLISMPFLNYGGPLGNETSRAQLCSQALSLARRLNVDLLEVRSRDVSPPGMNPAARKITILLPLPATPEQLWEEGFRSKLRNKIKRPINHGMEVRFGAAELTPFYEIFARNMRDLGTPVLPRRWFEAIETNFRDQVIFAAVYWRDAPVAAGCGFLWQKEFELTWSSALREHNSRHPNMLLCWALMQETIKRGADCFNFGRSTPDSSTHHFKEQWGGRDVPLPWGSWGRRATPPSPTSAKYRIARGVWSRLPIYLSKRIGPTLARQLP